MIRWRRRHVELEPMVVQFLYQSRFQVPTVLSPEQIGKIYKPVSYSPLVLCLPANRCRRMFFAVDKNVAL
jgi:hypothetical protein